MGETYGEALLAIKASVDLVLHGQGSRHAVVRASVLHDGVHPGLHLSVALGCVLLCSVGAEGRLISAPPRCVVKRKLPR